MSELLLQGHPGIGPKASGIAQVAADNFSARYDLDLREGRFSRPSHALFGESYVGRILVLNAAKGGVASAWMLHAMAVGGLVPAALLLNFANPIMAQGAALAGLPLIDRFESDVTVAIQSGDQVRVEPASGRVTVRRLEAG